MSAAQERRSARINARMTLPGGDNTVLCASMKDHIRYLEKFRTDAADCKLISDLAVDKTKRELFARLADLLGVLALEVQHAIARRANSSAGPPALATSEREDHAREDDDNERTEDAKRMVENYAARLRKLFKTLRRPFR